MNQSLFCADGSRAVQENPIGQASTHRVYVLIECPTPWEYHALDSSPLPSRLKELPREFYEAGNPVRFLLIYNQKLALPHHYRVMILEREAGWSQGYHKQVYQVNDLAAVPAIVEEHLAGNPPTENAIDDHKQDLLVCTHGSHDQCCARYGKPFFYEATKQIENLGDQQSVRIWEASHFGGHRFAPTVIDFPSGRYYGGIDASALLRLLQQTPGNYEIFRHIYRGWGILPETAQVLEQALILQWGWAWFENQVFLPISVTEISETEQSVELWYQQPNGQVGGYHGRIVYDPQETLCIRGSCSATKVSSFIQWRVAAMDSVEV
ncbi:MAG: sucrase ferredoxin, partial [Cyanobacteria bacterium]|nr:sucrase ferredoxin [Cyanobacteria bacterium GSL.Bin21]